MSLFLYSYDGPNNWVGWLTETEHRERLLTEPRQDADPQNPWAAYLEWRERAYKLAEKLGWFGETIDGPYVAGLPHGTPAGSPLVMVAWRDIDGTTFLASPLELSWLRDLTRSASAFE